MKNSPRLQSSLQQKNNSLFVSDNKYNNEMIPFIKKLYRRIYTHAENVGYPYVSYGWFQTISNPLFYLTWVYFDHQTYENLGIRIGINALCLPLALKKYWPAKWQYYLPLYWYFTALYTLPFFFAFMLLKNNFSYSWTLAALTGVVLCILLLDLAALIVLLPLGVLIAWVCYYFTTSNFIVLAANHRTIIISYACVIIFGALFAHRKEQIQKEKLKTVRTLAMDIAHELRTPLRAINLAADNIKYYLNDLISAYKLAKEAKLPVKEIRISQFDNLASSLDDIEAETNYSNTVINMILTNVEQENIKSGVSQICSISHCVNEALRRYPFQSDEKQLIHWESKHDFQFLGQELLTIHILFNLLKNSIYYIREAHKGEIYIWIDDDKNYNKLHFKDTAKGISADILPKVFDLFFTRTYHGSGIGLAFCKMVMKNYGGKIECESVEGEFAEFILSFPKNL